jgi:hypothetical protein
MTIMVDELHKVPDTAPSCFRVGGACHLTITGEPLENLHRFAAKLGLKRVWFQTGSTPHYDLTVQRRRKALQLGATFVPAKVQAIARVEAKRKAVETIDQLVCDMVDDGRADLDAMRKWFDKPHRHLHMCTPRSLIVLGRINDVRDVLSQLRDGAYT